MEILGAKKWAQDLKDPHEIYQFLLSSVLMSGVGWAVKAQQYGTLSLDEAYLGLTAQPTHFL